MPPNSTPKNVGYRKKTRSAQSKATVWIIGGLAIGAVAGLFAAQAWLESYLESEPFHLRIEASLGRVLHAEAKLSPLHRESTALAVERLTLAGQHGAPFSRARIQDLRAEVDLTGLWQRLWKVDNLSCQRLDLNFDSPSDLSEAPETSPHPAPGWMRSLLPNRTQIASIQTDRAVFTHEGSELRETRLIAKPQAEGWDIALEAGELNSPDLPLMTLTQARLFLRDGEVTLRNARLLVKTGGQLALTGEWANYNRADLHIQLENLALEPLLPKWWQACLRGNLSGELHMLRAPGTTNADFNGDVHLTNAKLEGLPLLNQLDAFLGNPRFRQVPLRTASAHIVKTAKRTEFQNIDLDADGILKMCGWVVLEKGELNGNLTLGLSPALVQWLPGARSKVFTESRDGYVWAPFQLSGTSEHPVEDLSPRLVATLVKTLTDSAGNLPDSIPKSVPEVTQGVLDAVKSLLPKK